MENTLEIEGRTHVSSSCAAELTGYTNDYIGQLCRAGKVKGVIVGRIRFVDKESLLAYAEEDHWAGKTLYVSTKSDVRSAEDIEPSDRVPSEKYTTFNSWISFPATVFITTVIIVLFAGMHVARVWDMAGQAVVAGDIFIATNTVTQGAPASTPKGYLTRWGRQTGMFFEYLVDGVSTFLGESFGGAFTSGVSLATVVAANNNSFAERCAVFVYRTLFGFVQGARVMTVRTLTLVLNTLGMPDTKETTTQSVMVVVPAAVNESENEAMKDRIRMSFSDEVDVTVGGDSSGIITPVFKSGKEDRYMFVMVPVGK
ncbi:MAG: helix-turn-helix domain-containing protein [Candidatus Yonathbacteria bacterium]|nr:helix-turn-helix domain-containing protein [Candidatus Yonathbacteria bacterium]